MTDPQQAIDLWIALAHISVGIGAIGLLVGVYGVGVTFGALRRVGRSGANAVLWLLALGDALLLLGLLIASAQQVGVGIVLIVLARSYTATLRAVMAEIGKGVAVAYLGYVAQVGITNFLAPCYLTVRALVIRWQGATVGVVADGDTDSDVLGDRVVHRGAGGPLRRVGGDRDTDL